MRVAIIAFNNIKYSPYIKTYTNLLERESVEYDVIIPNRSGINETINGNLLSLKWDKKKSKIYNFIRFARKTTKLLQKQNYNFVFVLTTLPAILLFPILIKKYSDRFLVDIRDYTYDKMPFFKNIEKLVLKKAHTRVLSSPAFKKFLPDLNYIICHNCPHKIEESVNVFNKASNPIKIGYVGSVSYIKECKRLIDLVKLDDRFCFYFYGNETSGSFISDYVKCLGINRIKFFGEYEPNEKANIISDIDILFNDYGNHSDLVRCALSNKLYDSFFYKKPLLTSPDTIMSQMADVYSFDVNETTTDLCALYEWYGEIDGEEMVAYMNSKLKQINIENSKFEEKIIEIIGEL